MTLPVFAAQQQRIIIDLPLPAAAFEQKTNLITEDSRARSHSLAKTTPAIITDQVPYTPSANAFSSISNSIQDTQPQLKNMQLSLANGQSLYRLFNRHRLSQADLSAMVSSSKQAKRLLSRLRAGQKISLWVTDQKRVEKLLLKTSAVTNILISRVPSGYRLENQTILKSEPAEQLRLANQEIPVADTIGPVAQSSHTLKTTVKSGDSLYLIFKRLNIPAKNLAQLMASKGAKVLKRLHPGQRITMQLGADNDLQSAQIQLNETQTLDARRNQNGYRLTTKVRPLDRHIATASATIESSLFLAGQRAGLSDAVTMQLVEIFGWDVDFALDIRAGDRFTLIYEELYREGKKLRDGRIIAAEFFNRGKSLRALRYQDSSGRVAYYAPNGLSMRKAFLRTPVSFSRISSRFNLSRKHPVLNRIRAHKGVDYAAPTGTPIKAAGDGRVVFAGWKRGYGKTIILRHGGKYSTLYGHMSRLHKRARRGNRINQGQIIGYVGQTGLTTGPHLHYEFRIQGVHKDPLRVKFPKALPIERRYKSDFLTTTRPLIVRLDHLATTSLAANP